MADPTFPSALLEYGARAYLTSVSPDGPHTSHVEVQLHGGKLCCWLSRTAVQNIERNPNVSLLWAPLQPGGYSIVVNGIVETSEIRGNVRGAITVTKSVFHRPGKRKDNAPGPCTADCKVLPFEYAA